ncbi:MAG TPA: GNAT family N-acetyltransferase [Pseudomonadales bacterium]
MHKSLDPHITLRPAVAADIAWLELWDDDPAVVSAASDDPDATVAFGCDWADELTQQDAYSRYYIGECDGRPIGAMQVIDPHMEATHYWGRIERHLRALDIWIGAAADRSKGYGEMMMRRAFVLCFADPGVTAIVIDPLNSNTRAHAFYRRLGFVPTHRQTFGGTDDCLVHRLTRAAWAALFPRDVEEAV